MQSRKQTYGATFLFLAALITLCSANALGATIYIPDRYPTIQQAINAAFEGDVIVVRDGTYLLTEAIDFKGKALTVKSQNGASNCILDGQQKTRVAYFHSGETNGSILSGFTIQNGYADKGGGIYCEESSPTIAQCTIRRNTAYATPNAYGGAICLKSSSASITNCQISNNKSSASYLSAGGGIYGSASSPNISYCTISGNTADASNCCGSSEIYSARSYGGGIAFEGGWPVISASSIAGNVGSASSRYGYTASYGGGLFFWKASSPLIINSVIINNNTTALSSDFYGGGLYTESSFLNAKNTIIAGNSSGHGAGIALSSSSANLTNCTVARNTASLEGGGLYCLNSSPQIVNSILWEDSPTEIVKANNANPTVTYSDISGGYTGTGNINSNPLFMDIATQDFHLKSSSPCVNTGDNAAPYLPDTDKDGYSRISNGTVDMGAYEYRGCPLPDKATLLSPSGTTTASSPTYTWKFVPNATWYYLWVNDSTGNKIASWYTDVQSNCSASTGTCSVTPQVTLAGGAAQWWVQTWSSCGYGPWSAAANFTAEPIPGTAILISPKGPDISTTPTYTWNAVSSATHYLLLVKDYSTFPRIQSWYTAAEAGCASGTGTCSVKPSVTLLPGRAQWWIETYNSNGYGPWSDELAFTVTGTAAPGKATLISPTGTITGTSPTFRWNAVPTASWYYLYVQDSTSFSGRITTWFTAAQAGCGSGTGTCSITPNTVLASGAAIWWIRTWSDLGTGPWSDGMSFTVP